MMTRKMYRVMMELLESSGKWLDMRDMAKGMNMMTNQVSALISHVDNTHIERDGYDVRFSGTDEEAWTAKYAVTKECYSLEDEDFTNVFGTLSKAGAISVMDICNETGLGSPSVIAILKTIRHIAMVREGTVKLYYLTE